MPTVDLYGRNPNVEAATFTYPSALVEDMPAVPPLGARFFFKPPEANPVLGVPVDTRANIHDTFVRLDPNNVYYRRGSGGLGAYNPAPAYDYSGVGTPSREPRGKSLATQGVEAAKRAVRASVSAFKDPAAQSSFSVAGRSVGGVWSEMTPVTKVITVIIGVLVLKKVF